ncbi:MAG: hypothetical protein ACXWJW_06140 [Xanthobacteraceae bacterium]
MTYVVAIVVGLIGTVAGWFAGGFAEHYLPSWLIISDVRIAGQVLTIGVREACALIGVVIGVLLSLRLYGGYRGKGSLIVHGTLVTILTVGLIYGASAGGDALFEALGVNPLAPVVEFEIRLPPGSKLPTAQDDVQVELHTDRNEIIATLNAIAQVGDRPMLTGYAPLVFRTPQRTIVMSLVGQPVQVFRLRLPARPSPSAEFGPWQQVDFLGEAMKEVRRADVTADYAIRYRVR